MDDLSLLGDVQLLGRLVLGGTSSNDFAIYLRVQDGAIRVGAVTTGSNQRSKDLAYQICRALDQDFQGFP